MVVSGHGSHIEIGGLSAFIVTERLRHRVLAGRPSVGSCQPAERIADGNSKRCGVVVLEGLAWRVGGIGPTGIRDQAEAMQTVPGIAGNVVGSINPLYPVADKGCAWGTGEVVVVGRRTIFGIVLIQHATEAVIAEGTGLAALIDVGQISQRVVSILGDITIAAWTILVTSRSASAGGQLADRSQASQGVILQLPAVRGRRFNCDLQIVQGVGVTRHTTSGVSDQSGAT